MPVEDRITFGLVKGSVGLGGGVKTATVMWSVISRHCMIKIIIALNRNVVYDISLRTIF